MAAQYCTNDVVRSRGKLLRTRPAFYLFCLRDPRGDESDIYMFIKRLANNRWMF